MDDFTNPARDTQLSGVKVLTLTTIGMGLAVFIALFLNETFSLDAIRSHRESLHYWAQKFYLLSPVVFAVAYAFAVAFCIPGAVFITIAAGFMFGSYLGTVYAVVGATMGAVAVFLVAEYLLARFLTVKAGLAIKHFKVGFRENELSYMLILRLVPLFPFWLVNIVPALCGVSLRTYTIGTLTGIIPGTFVYALVGAGAGAVLEAGEDLNVGLIFEIQFLAPIIGLAVLASTPMLYKRITRFK
ncbi:MAG: VTT domain-containing protein [Pseudomonadota bacterium]|nr:VTT domain-containing protein [Pseudomonadota bacterium]